MALVVRQPESEVDGDNVMVFVAQRDCTAQEGRHIDQQRAVGDAPVDPTPANSIDRTALTSLLDLAEPTRSR
jgi:hypothetical protein